MSNDLSRIGFDENSFRQEFRTVLDMGLAAMLDSKDDASCLSAYNELNANLQQLVEDWGAPEHLVNELRDEMIDHSGAVLGKKNVDVEPYFKPDFRKTCVLILKGLGYIGRSDSIVNDTLDVLMGNGVGKKEEDAKKFDGLDKKEVRNALCEISRLPPRNTLREIIKEVSASKKLNLMPFLKLLEKEGNFDTRKAASEAVAELQSTKIEPPRVTPPGKDSRPVRQSVFIRL